MKEKLFKHPEQTAENESAPITCTCKFSSPVRKRKSPNFIPVSITGIILESYGAYSTPPLPLTVTRTHAHTYVHNTYVHTHTYIYTPVCSTHTKNIGILHTHIRSFPLFRLTSLELPLNFAVSRVLIVTIFIILSATVSHRQICLCMFTLMAEKPSSRAVLDIYNLKCFGSKILKYSAIKSIQRGES
jgi:hypothetical protein